ncbi:monoacylglycerol/Diacylglycerol O-acyltransferase-like isoform X2 [Corticium candelabrum]|uniref:monoacylglycerol/Diacylglycerol O-acyltransferase-like isoform X2 n=1 Tax=Corticium candelabrum TaxID=121492 RepID=UPI002E265084|nr:monoacylglycerol/Diacylglycerol O-acyltransferase-like isoform X2 [Corticium candelabrum]
MFAYLFFVFASVSEQSAIILSALFAGYEVVGLENIPERGGALVVAFHGALALDMYFLISRVMLVKHRLMQSVADRFLFRCWGLGPFLQLCGVIPGTRDQALQCLKSGSLLCIAPGGVREALFSGKEYEILWGQRSGFAQVAIAAGVVTTCMNKRPTAGLT